MAAVAADTSDPLGDLIAALLSTPFSGWVDAIDAAVFMAKAAADASTLGHTCFGTALVGNTGLTYVQYAIAYLNSLATPFTH